MTILDIATWGISILTFIDFFIKYRHFLRKYFTKKTSNLPLPINNKIKDIYFSNNISTSQHFCNSDIFTKSIIGLILIIIGLFCLSQSSKFGQVLSSAALILCGVILIRIDEKSNGSGNKLNIFYQIRQQ